MYRLDAMLAPRALTAAEVASIIAPQLIVYGVAHRAFIHSETLQDSTKLESAVVSTSENALAAIVDDAMKSVSDWLGDVEADGEPRFYRKGAVMDVVVALCNAAADKFVRCEDIAVAGTLAEMITDRDQPTMKSLLDATGVTA